jgi:hypothetical protein
MQPESVAAGLVAAHHRRLRREAKAALGRRDLLDQLAEIAGRNAALAPPAGAFALERPA